MDIVVSRNGGKYAVFKMSMYKDILTFVSRNKKFRFIVVLMKISNFLKLLKQTTKKGNTILNKYFP